MLTFVNTESNETLEIPDEIVNMIQMDVVKSTLKCAALTMAVGIVGGLAVAIIQDVVASKARKSPKDTVQND